jgi:DNA (cytosine-5)-methyltransferase 1
MKHIEAVDLFCGAGGATAGMELACEHMGYALDVLAINHWAVAISTHSANHPNARNICWPVEQVSPKRVIPDGRLNILWASPECTHHSIARGGKPVSDQKRAGAWEICRWATELLIDNIVVENVREFAEWGPIGADGHPLKSRKGDTFRAWVKAMESLNYRVEWQVLNCADYGDATSRKRLFVLMKRGRGHIEWPKATHCDPSVISGQAGRESWRAAREIIDWNLRGQSIFNRKRPLKQRTLDRIAAGLRKFGGAAAEPFLVMLYGTNDARSVERPCPTITSGGQHVGLCEPFIVGMEHEGRVHGCEKPLPTVTTARGGAMGLIEPFLVSYHNGHDCDRRTHPLNGPMPTQDCSNRYGLCEPFLINYHGNSTSPSVRAPLDTITARDRFGLVEPQYLDILFRMLQPHEIAAAHSFPAEYRFQGSKEDVVKQIGNSVPRRTAAALTEAQLAA